MTLIVRNSKLANATQATKRVEPFVVKLFGVDFQAFMHPATLQPVFSQAGVAKGLKIDDKTARRWLGEIRQNPSNNKDYTPGSKLATSVNSNPIAVVTMADLIALVAIASDKGYPVAIAMNGASFPVVLQQSVDEALGIERSRAEYLQAGAQLKQAIEGRATTTELTEYIDTYHKLKHSTFSKNKGVRGLCKINRNISAMAVSDADKRREITPHWRKSCTSDELSKITLSNSTVQRALDAGVDPDHAYKRLKKAFALIDKPF